MGIWHDYPFEGTVAVLFDFGGVSHELLASKNSVTDIAWVWDRFRIRLVMCDMDAMLQTDSPDSYAVETLASQWEQGAQQAAAGTHAPIRANARLFLAIQQVLARTQARAAAINCHAMPQHALHLPCVAMVELHRTGVLARRLLWPLNAAGRQGHGRLPAAVPHDCAMSRRRRHRCVACLSGHSRRPLAARSGAARLSDARGG